MKKQDIVLLICFLLILLFVYTAMSKILSYSKFVDQMEQSPLFHHWANGTVWLIPSVELIISALLLREKTRLTGLWLSTMLMLSFTIYVIYIRYYSPFIPCTCGGIISSMNWDQHIYFNVAFTILSLIGAVLQKRTSIDTSQAVLT